MSEKELNSYRFSPEQEPTDDRKATERYFEAMRRNALAKQAKWAHAIELALNEK